MFLVVVAVFVAVTVVTVVVVVVVEPCAYASVEFEALVLA